MQTLWRAINFFLLISTGYCSIKEWWTREKCIDELGCFYAGSPFFDIIERPVSLLPDDRDVIDTKFFLFTSENENVGFVFYHKEESLEDTSKSGFNPKLKTKFVIPGFMSVIASYWKMPMVYHLLENEPCNVFLVDWSGGDGPLYEQAVANTRVVGAEIAQFIKNLQKRTGLSLDSIHLIGHSLGAHIAGYAGKRLNKIGRITALDPAGPYFTEVDPVVRLDKSDAQFVDAIHTNAAPSRFQGFGLTDSIGHLDFWPNGGHVQPGCPYMGSSIWSFLSHPSIDYEGLHDIMCNHLRSIDLFMSSINYLYCKLVGTVYDKWEDFVDDSSDRNDSSKKFLMGMHADQLIQFVDDCEFLNVYLNTSDTEPFCERWNK